MRPSIRQALVFAALVLAQPFASAFGAVQLVTDETIQTQRSLTSLHKLRNGIPVIVRQVPHSDIVQLNVMASSGLKDLPVGKKALNEWLWEVLPMSAKDFPKAKVYSIAEKYGLDIGCQGGIEYSYCGLGTLKDYWRESLPLFAALVTQPSFMDEDAKLTKERVIARLRNTPSDPGKYINEIINSIFYPVGHPYRLNHDEAIKELESLRREELVAYHKQVLVSGNLTLVAVTSMPPAQVVADLDKAFGGIPAGSPPHVEATPPVFAPLQSYTLNDRDLPTAYIRIKFNAPGITDKDGVATRLLYAILDEELDEEVRTRRSLSYATHSGALQYHVGVGIISSTTSKPKETLVAINEVLQALKSKTYTDEELEEFKHSFATSYYLTQETNASLASALANAHFFYGDANEHYELPRRLDQVTPADIKRLANQWLANPRIGVIYGRGEFKDEWAQDLVKKNLAPAAEAQKTH